MTNAICEITRIALLRTSWSASSFCWPQRWRSLLFRWKSWAVTNMPRPQKLHLIRDVLDKLLVDRDNIPLGRVDGIVLLVRGEHAQPHVVQIECGIATLLRRLSNRFAKLVQRIRRRLGLHWRRSVRIDWSRIDQIGRTQLTLDICAEESALLARERWLRDHIIKRIPGNGI
jgi:hypothetical protein